MLFRRGSSKSNRVHILAHGPYEVAYFIREGKAYRRQRLKGFETWKDTTEQEIPIQQFHMVQKEIEQVRQAYLAGKG